jgi:hypothetical protein
MHFDTSRLQPEAELLLLCAAPNRTSGDDKRLRELIDTGLNWDHTIKSAQNHRIIPLLYRSLATASHDLVPDAIMEKLRKGSLLNTMRNLALSRELIDVLDKLEDNGITSMPFKGPIMAQSAYGDISLRQFDDLDILVPPAKIAEVDELLSSMGYQEEDQKRNKVSKAQAAAMQKYQHHHHFYSPTSKAHIEVHWTLSPELYSLHQDTANLWKRSELVDLEDRKIMGLSCEDTLVLICDHAARHQWNRLSWLCDVSMVLANKALDWEIAMDQAAEWRSKKALFLGLFLAEDMLGAPLPYDVAEKVMIDRAVKDLASHAVDQLFPNGMASQDLASDHAIQNIQDQLFYIRSRDGFFDRARLHLRLASKPTVEDWDALPLPDQFFFLYHLVRPVRQACSYRTKIFSWLFK